MFCTEEEAKKKWCPMVRVSKSEFDGFFDNRQGNGVVTYCIGSQCMVWVWGQDYVRDTEEGKIALNNAQGYCGLVK